MTATAITERAIDLTGEEVRGILDGSLSRLLRPVEPQPERSGDGWLYDGQFFGNNDSMESYLFHDVYGGDKGMPYGGVYSDGSADRLWVRETWMPFTEDGTPVGRTIYQATDKPEPDGDGPLVWRSAQEMPREFSRFTLEIIDVEVEHNGKVWQWSITFKRV